MPRKINHEAESADFVFFGGYEKARLSAAFATAANRRHAFDKARSMGRTDRGDDDPIRRMLVLKRRPSLTCDWPDRRTTPLISTQASGSLLRKVSSTDRRS